MRCSRIVFFDLRSASDPKRARVNALGLRAMLEQEGLPYLAHSAMATLPGAPGDVVLIAGSSDPDEREAGLLAEVLRRYRFVWLGEAPTTGALAQVLGLTRARGEGVTNALYAIDFRSYPFRKQPLHEYERRLKIKYCPVLASMRGGAGGYTEVASVRLWDGKRIGPAVLAGRKPMRRVVIPFALGWAFAFNVSAHHDLRRDLDMMDYPLQAHSDLYRNLLRDVLVWTAAPHYFIRPYYWPVTDGRIPAGAFCLNHDCCGFSRDGLRLIRDVCAQERIRTCFFDYPENKNPTSGSDAKFRLTRADAKGHDVALHIEDASSFQEIVRCKRALEKVQGRTIRGWRRHDPTWPQSYPRIWHHLKRSGIQWTAAWGVHSSPALLISEGTSTGNRLPFRILDLKTARALDLLELPTFDSQDAERLTAIDYGQRLTWQEWSRSVRLRFDHAERHNLLTGYLLHVWSAGVRKEQGHLHGALDAQRMMRWIIRLAKRRSFCVMGHEELYDWWTFRRRIRIHSRGDSVEIALAPDPRSVAFEILSAGQEPRSIRVNGQNVQVRRWRARKSWIFNIPKLKRDQPLVVEVLY